MKRYLTEDEEDVVWKVGAEFPRSFYRTFIIISFISFGFRVRGRSLVTTLETIYSKYFESIALLLLSSFIHLILLPLAVKIYLKVGPIEVKTLLHLLSLLHFQQKYT